MSATAKQRREWRRLSDELGWAANDGTVPTLESVVRGERAMAFAFRPLLSSQGPRKWDEMAAQMAHRMGFPTKEVKPHPTDPDLVVFVFGTESLPNVYMPEAVPDHGKLLFEVGYGAGTPRIIDLASSPNTLWTGPTRWGKGVGLRAMQLQAIAKGFRIITFNPTGAPEFGWMRDDIPDCYVVSGDGEDVDHALNQLIHEVEMVTSTMDGLGIDSWLEMDDHQPTLLCLDELDLLMAIGKARNDNAYSVKAAIGYLASKAAKAGVFCVATVQIALSDLMGTFARTNFSNRIAVGPAERGALELIFGSLADDTDVMELRRRIKGRGLINSEVGLDALQVPFFEREFIPSLLAPHMKGVTP